MKARELANLGVPRGEAMKLAVEACMSAAKAQALRPGSGQAGINKATLRETVQALLADPQAYAAEPVWGPLAAAIGRAKGAQDTFIPRPRPAPWRQWGTDLEDSAIQQLRNACNLPVSVAGALMPDAHQGYGLPIGGVLATDNAVIPFAVGVDIACRMKLTVLDLPPAALSGQRDRLASALERETFFGVGTTNRGKREHAVMDEDWSVTPITARLKDRAAGQLGTSGSGNHFVEFGTLTLDCNELGLAAGVYLALLSHSGSRGTGAGVAEHYSKLAQEKHPESAQGTVSPGLAGPRQRRRAAILAGDGAHGPLRGGKPRAHSPPHRPASGRGRAAGHREPP